MCHRVTTRLDCHPDSVTAGRRFVSDALASWGMIPADAGSAARRDILLVATELLSNAVKAAATPILLSVDAHRNRVDISVTDDNPDPAIRLPTGSSIDAPGGRGLLIVDALALHWGQRRLDDRTKEVWAQLSVPDPAALAVDCTLTLDD
jgi:anti-sigma regulatory factor (Ser/Thr protein kinase)